MTEKLAIRREAHGRWERRAPLIPSHVKELIRSHSLEIAVQPSEMRIFSDEDYHGIGAEILEDLSSCSVILGVKEVPLPLIQDNKVYVFFSHTIKGQPGNMPMLKRLMETKCTLIDYEKITDDKGQRTVFFGPQAGQAGMIDTLWLLGKRMEKRFGKNVFSSLRQAYQYASLVDARENLEEIGWNISKKGLDPLPVPLVCGFGGYGRVSQGAQALFDLLPSQSLNPEDLPSFFDKKHYAPNRVYKVIFKEEHLVEPLPGQPAFELQDYYEHPSKYRSRFDDYLPYLSVLVNCIYWEPRYPRFVTKESVESIWKKQASPRLAVIGDISCDIQGAVEFTVKATNPGQPAFIYDPIHDRIQDGLEGEGIAVMAVDNLPAEIPLESSVSFSRSLKPLIPALARADFNTPFSQSQLPSPIKRAVILYKGKLTPDFQYLQTFL